MLRAWGLENDHSRAAAQRLGFGEAPKPCRCCVGFSRSPLRVFVLFPPNAMQGGTIERKTSAKELSSTETLRELEPVRV